MNGQVMSVTIDDDPVARAPQGILSLQLETSGPVWYRNVYRKQQEQALTSRDSSAVGSGCGARRRRFSTVSGHDSSRLQESLR
jgi:hypothetical protein